MFWGVEQGYWVLLIIHFELLALLNLPLQLHFELSSNWPTLLPCQFSLSRFHTHLDWIFRNVRTMGEVLQVFAVIGEKILVYWWVVINKILLNVQWQLVASDRSLLSQVRCYNEAKEAGNVLELSSIGTCPMSSSPIMSLYVLRSRMYLEEQMWKCCEG